MEKLKTRSIVGWRQRENDVRRTRVRMRASASAFKGSPQTAVDSKKKTEPVV